MQIAQDESYQSQEMFEIIDEHDCVIGRAPRSECHGNPALLHRAVHVIVFDPESGNLLLQKRAENKDIQPGKWDTAVGGHVQVGEDYEQAARREMNEELGMPSNWPLTPLFNSKIRNEIESENIRVFGAAYAGPFHVQHAEISEVRFFTRGELIKLLLLPPEENHFTPNLIKELNVLLRIPLPENIA